MNELDCLFPKAERRPPKGNEIVPELKNVRFLSWRNGPEEGDTIRPLGAVPVGITKKGIDLEGRKLYKDPNGIKLFFSFPPPFIFAGNEQQQRDRLGNSVPPLLMRSIARQIKYVMFCGDKPKPEPMNKYLTILEAAWQDHLKPREENAPTVVSTFAGAGGSSLGYSMAGFRELLAVEWDDNAVETFKLNFPGVPVYHGDIAKLTVEQALEMTGLQPGDLDVLDGSPPCQGFSTAGKRVMDDPRNQLFREYVRLLRGLKPKVFVMENVSGMVKGKMKLIFAEILRELKASGYKVSARLLNAMYFNVPQSRERMIFIGVREDLGIEPSHPGAEGRPFTVRDAWENLHIPADELSYAFRVIESRKGSIAPVLALAGEGVQLSKIEARGFYFNWQRLGFCTASPTIPKEDINLCHPQEMRIITPTECKRLASFPDGFVLRGKPDQTRNRIGNSVPPLFMRSIARRVRGQILDKTNEIHERV